MPSPSVATGTFSSRSEANAAIRRLVSSGFARNSIELLPHDDGEGYDLEIHTRRENLRRAERLIHGSASRYAVGQALSGAAETARAHPVVLLGAGILAGFTIYTLLSRTVPTPRMQSRQRQGRARC